jgi:hypothetical protein
LATCFTLTLTPARPFHVQPVLSTIAAFKNASLRALNLTYTQKRNPAGNIRAVWLVRHKASAFSGLRTVLNMSELMALLTRNYNVTVDVVEMSSTMPLREQAKVWNEYDLIIGVGGAQNLGMWMCAQIGPVPALLVSFWRTAQALCERFRRFPTTRRQWTQRAEKRRVVTS